MFFQSYLLTVLPTYLPQFLYVNAGQQNENSLIIDMTFIVKRGWMIGFCVSAPRITALGINSPTAKTYPS